MKTKLLRKLRRIHTIQKRNNEYRYFCTEECLGDVYNKTAWFSDFLFVKNFQRERILEDARRYKKPKQIL